MAAASMDESQNNEKDLSDLTQDELSELDAYAPADGVPIVTIETTMQPELNVPDDIITQANTVKGRSHRERAFLTWAIVDGWKTSNAYVDVAYGPTRKNENNFMMDGTGANFPNGYVKYKNILTPCGTYIQVYPDEMAVNTTSISIANLPDGLGVVANTGMISGTPTTVQDSARYVACGTADSGGSCRTTFNIEIYAASDAPQIVYRNLNTAATGVAFNLTPTTWVIPTGSIPTVNPTLPAGLSFTSANGVISGTPTTPQARKVYTVRAPGLNTISNIDFGDAFSLAVCGIGYPSAVYNLATTSLPINVAKTILPTVWTGIGAATISPALPTGLSFTSANGAISGTPTVATPPKVYTIAYSGAGSFASIEDQTTVTFNVCSVTNHTPSGFHWEIQPITTSASDWDNSLDGNFSGLFKIIDHRVSPPSSITLLCGKIQQVHPLVYVIERSSNYACNIFLRNGSYPAFIYDAGTAWWAAHRTGGIKGVRLVGESIGGVKLQTGQKTLYFRSLSGTNTSFPGVTRDLSFSNIYFSGTSGLGVKGFIIQDNTSGTVVPGIHFYDCTIDAKGLPLKWIIRDYNAIDRRFIRTKFYDNWKPQEGIITTSEHGYYNTGDFGVNFFEDCLFSGIGRNAIQAGNYRVYNTIQNGTNYVPRAIGGWVVRNTSAIQCGMANWMLSAGAPLYKKNSYGSVYYTFAGVSAAHILGCNASGGYHRLTHYPQYDFDKGTGALVVWKNPNTVSVDKTTDPEFYGNKIVVVSSCAFYMKQAGAGEFDLVNLKNIRQLWVSGGRYYHPGAAIFQLSSHVVNGTVGDEQQGYNPNSLPYIASSFFNFQWMNVATFIGGYPPYVKANCLPLSNCTLIGQTQFEALVNAVDQPPPTAPVKPTDGTFLYEAGFTHPITGVFTP